MNARVILSKWQWTVLQNPLTILIVFICCTEIQSKEETVVLAPFWGMQSHLHMLLMHQLISIRCSHVTVNITTTKSYY